MKVKEKNIRQKFQQLYEQSKPKPNILLNSIRAFWTGGLICIVGEVIYDILIYFGIEKFEAMAFESILMILIGSILTGLGIYDKIGDYAGAGSVVPITGFANSIVSPAIEFKKEGFVFGVASKMFVIAGPVLVYGITSSFILGLLYYFFRW